MPFRRCGDSGLMLPAISLGFWHNFGADDDFEEARRMMRRAFDCGVTHFDLANNYDPPPGSAEDVAGRVLVGDFACHRGELVISTKAGHDMWNGPYGSNPHFPASGPATGPFNGPHLKSKFLAASDSIGISSL